MAEEVKYITTENGIQGSELVVLIGGGDKSTQKNDIRKAKILWRQYNEN